VEHDAVQAWCDPSLPTSGQGVVTTDNPAGSAIQLANSETGILQSVPQGVLLCDMTQAFGKIPLAFNWSGADMAIISAHKLGGPKGIGALVIKRGIDIAARIRGGGQEMGRRSGTENIIGIAGFGAAAQAAQQDLEQGVWQNVEKLRNILEKAIAQSSNRTIFVGKDAPRLPNTSYFVTPGWKGETQVMQMDLSGFAVSAGSACSSGKVKASKVLKAMGYDDDMASCAVRVSLGPSTTENDIQSFCDAWCAHYAKFASRHWGNNR
jgi:cysteine desulfurase